MFNTEVNGSLTHTNFSHIRGNFEHIYIIFLYLCVSIIHMYENMKLVNKITLLYIFIHNLFRSQGRTISEVVVNLILLFLS